MNAPPELGLELPLRGVQLIEASAGTGKTHALATLYARLVIEAGLGVPQLLAVTYTRAAAAELRERLRQRLQQALTRIETSSAADPPDALDRLLAQARERESAAALRARLQRAVAGMDAAPIHTIHAFCQRVLIDHALEAGQALTPRTLQPDADALRREIATAFWRRHSRDRNGARALEVFRSPDHLARVLRDLLAVEALEPAPAADLPDSGALLEHARSALHAAFAAHAADARRQLQQAWESGAIHRTYSKSSSVDAVFAALERWQDSDADEELHDNTGWYAASALRARWSPAKGALPTSPLFDAIESWVTASAAAAAQQAQERLVLLHRLRSEGAERLSRLERERDCLGYDGLVREVAGALAGAQGDALAARLQAQYRVALVDEFQDTDPRQAAIFFRLFARPGAQDPVDAASRALILIGDPKQAIYRFRGGDVVAYLVARHRADARHTLDHNFRSRPALLRALDALYQHAGRAAFAHPDIGFHPVQPGGICHDRDFTRDAVIAPAITVLHLDQVDSSTPIDAVRRAAAAACADALLALLQDGLAGRALRRSRHGDVGAVRPGDIAVLVEKHEDAQIMRDALAARGIAATASGRDSVLASDEAEDLRVLLLALRAPGDEGRLRAALATPLLGFDAAALAALDHDDAPLRRWQERLQEAREQFARSGPLALVAALTAERAPALLALPRGERRVANYLHLGERLQALARITPSVDALLDAWEQRLDASDPHDDEELPRLESDAERVAILTLHRSKGLEFEFVFLPFIATHGAGQRRGTPELIAHHDGERRILVVADADAEGAVPARAREREEERAERLRLLYVGLTRARLATWIAWGRVRQLDRTALAWLLHRDSDADTLDVPDAARLQSDLRAWQARAPDAVALQPAAESGPTARYAPPAPPPPPPARVAARVLTRDWWVYSYSLLAREERNEHDMAQAEDGAEDEAERIEAERLDDPRFVGARFGNALHRALELADFPAWRDWNGPEPPLAERGTLEAALRAEGYGGEADLQDGIGLLAALVAATLNTRLSEGLRLCDLAAQDRRDELEFHLSLAPTSVDALLRLLHAHGVASERRGFGTRRAIEGLLTGRIDLLYRHAGRWYVLDYKSNRLTDYRPEALRRAIRESEYDLQYVLYTLAVHRWLRFRLGAAYDYARDFGGVRYLFCRGLVPQRDAGAGVHALQVAPDLIGALDVLFANGTGGSA